LVEQRPRLDQVERVEALGEPAVDGGEEVVDLLALALIAPKPREARRRAKLPGAGLARPRDFGRARPPQSCLVQAMANAITLVWAKGPFLDQGSLVIRRREVIRRGDPSPVLRVTRSCPRTRGCPARRG